MLHLLLIISILITTVYSSPESDLKKILLKNYDKTSRPVLNESDSVTVTVGLTLQSILEVDIEKGTLTTIAWFNLNWNDPQLMWLYEEKFDKYKNVPDIRLPVSQVWSPDVEVYNGISQELTTKTDNVVIYSRGEMTNIPAYRLVTSCKVDSTWYPFDDQTCDIKIGSWVYNGFKVDLKLMAPEEADLGSYISNTEWDLIGAPAKRHEVYYECCPEPYVDVTYSIHLKRRTSKYWSTIIIPQYLLSLICLCASFIPLSAPTPRLVAKFLLMFLLCITCPKSLPSPSLLASMLGTNFLILIFSILIDIIMISVSLYTDRQEMSQKKPMTSRILKFVDIALTGSVLAIFVLCALYMILSAPFLSN